MIESVFFVLSPFPNPTQPYDFTYSTLVDTWDMEIRIRDISSALHS
jgi:hypothetical protein